MVTTVSKCANEISKASEGLIGKEEAEGLIAELRTRAEKRRKNGDTRSVDEIIFQEGKAMTEKATVEAKIRKRNAIKQVMAMRREQGFVSQFDNKFHALQAILGGKSMAHKGAKNSIDANQKAIKMQLLGGLAQDLQKAGVLERFNSGELNAHIEVEIWNLTAKPDKVKPSGNKDAVEIAKIIHKWQRYSVDRQNRAGAWIRELDGYIVRQSHDMDKIRVAGFEKWYEDTISRLGEETFEGVKAGQETEYLKNIYEALATGIHEGHGKKHFNVSKAMATSGNMARSISQERTLHFKSAADWSAYNKEYGKGNVREAVFTGLELAAENIGLMERLGPDPHRTYDALVSEVIKELKPLAAAGDKSAAKQLNKIQGDNLQSLMAEVDGTTRIPVSAGAGRWQSNVRAIQSMSKLGGATVTSITDLPSSSMELSYQGHNFLSGWGQIMKTFFRGRGNQEQKEIAQMLGVGFEGMLGEVYSRFSAEDSLPGKTAGLMHNYFKLNLQNWWNDSFKTTIGLIMSNNLAMATKKGYAALDENLKRVLGLYDIDGENWELVRKLSKKTSDGKEFVTPDLVRGIPDAEIKKVIGGEPSANQIAAFKDKLETNLRSYFVDRADHAVPTPGANERAFMLRGTQPGTVEGEVLRFFWQFKSFPLTFLSKLYGRELQGRASLTDTKSVMGIAHGGKASMAVLTQMMIGSTIFGYLAMSMKDIAKGRDPRDVFKDGAVNLNTITAAMTQGGGLGLYGDFLFGEFDRFGNSPLQALAGPSFGAGSDALATLHTLWKDGDKGAAKTVKLLMNNSGVLAFLPKVGKATQLGNMFYTKLAMDHMFLYQVQESMNPGFLKRMKKNLKKNSGQEFLIDPQ